MNIEALFGTPLNNLTHKSSIVDANYIPTNLIEDLQREYKFNIDLGQYNDGSPIDTKAIFIKGDKNTSVLKAYITQNGLIVNLTGLTVTANIKEGENEIVTIPCNIVDAMAGLIEINLSESYVDEYGENIFEVALQKEDKIVISQQYKYTVFNSLGEGNFGSETQLTVLQSLIDQVQNKINKVDEMLSELKVTSQDIDEIIGMIGVINVK